MAPARVDLQCLRRLLGPHRWGDADTVPPDACARSHAIADAARFACFRPGGNWRTCDYCPFSTDRRTRFKPLPLDGGGVGERVTPAQQAPCTASPLPPRYARR